MKYGKTEKDLYESFNISTLLINVVGNMDTGKIHIS
jgi:hypothetical protein